MRIFVRVVAMLAAAAAVIGLATVVGVVVFGLVWDAATPRHDVVPWSIPFVVIAAGLVSLFAAAFVVGIAVIGIALVRRRRRKDPC